MFGKLLLDIDNLGFRCWWRNWSHFCPLALQRKRSRNQSQCCGPRMVNYQVTRQHPCWSCFLPEIITWKDQRVKVEHWYPSCSWHITHLFQAQNHNLTVIYKHETHLFQAGLQARLLLRSTNLFKGEKCSFKENIFHLNIQSSQTYVPNVKTLIQTAKWFMAFLLLWHWKHNQKDFLAALV